MTIKKLGILILMMLFSSCAYCADFRPDDCANAPDGYWIMGEASGDRADSSGNGYTLTDQNTVGNITPGKFETYAANFVRTNTEYLSRADNVIFEPGSGDFMFSVWLKPSGTATYVIASKWDADTPEKEWLCYTTSSTIRFFGSTDGTTDDVNHNWSYTWQSGVWQNLIIRKTGTTITAFVDGDSKGDKTDNITYYSGGNDFFVSAYTAAGGSPGVTYDGAMQDFAWWKGDIPTDTEIGYLGTGVGPDQNTQTVITIG